MRLHHALRAAAGQARGSYIPEDGLLAWYDGEGLSGSTVTNNVSGGADASVNGAPVVGSDSVVSNYIDFDGVDDSLWAAITAARDDFTMSVKVLFSEPFPSGDNISNFFASYSGSSSNYLSFLNYDHTNSDFDKTFHAKNTGAYSQVAWSPSASGWVTVTVSVSGATVSIYVDGSLNNQSNLAEVPVNNFSRVSFASSAHTLSNFTECNMTDMLVYNYARNDCEEINLI